MQDVDAYAVRVWNSGTETLKDLPIRCVFFPPDNDFRILHAVHNTTPQFEFGAIKETHADSLSRRFVYGLLNPGDEDLILLFVHSVVSPVRLEVFSKTEGLTVKHVEARRFRVRQAPLWALSLVALLGSLAAVTAHMTLLRRRRKL
jgi:hypothetical protein